MTRKHYVAIARAIAAEYAAPHATPASRDALDNVIAQLAIAMKADNARFDRARFVAACKSETRR